MRLAGALLAAALAWATPALAQDGALHALLTGDDAAPWEAVGRLDIDGKGFCTGTLIAPDLVLTAAHCLFDRESGAAVTASRISFRAGFRDGWVAAERGVSRVLPHPAYVFDPDSGASQSAHDLALIELAQPIRGPIAPFPTADEPLPGAAVSIVSYAVGRSEVPSLEEACGVLGQERGVYVLACHVDFGASGAPIFAVQDGVARIVSVVSAKGELAGRPVALGTSLTEPLEELRLALAEAGPEPLPQIEQAPGRLQLDAHFVSARGVLTEAEGLPR